MTRAACTDPALGELLGAYILGACEENERKLVEAHIAGCEACGEEARRLAVVRDALMTEVPPVTPGGEVRARLMGQVRAEAELFATARTDASRARDEVRGRWWGLLRWPSRPLPALALACTLVALGVAGGVLAVEGEESREQVVVADVQGGAGALRVADDGDARLEVRGLPDPGRGRIYQVWLARDGRPPEPTDALFGVRPGGRAEVAVPGDVRRYDHVLVTSEPAGGSQAPTRPPVVRASV